jgi:hypothetical protein
VRRLRVKLAAEASLRCQSTVERRPADDADRAGGEREDGS